MNVKQLIEMLQGAPPVLQLSPGDMEFIKNLDLRPDDGSPARTQVLAAIGKWTLVEAHIFY